MQTVINLKKKKRVITLQIGVALDDDGEPSEVRKKANVRTI
jgi:hypothetical protein